MTANDVIAVAAVISAIGGVIAAIASLRGNRDTQAHLAAQDVHLEEVTGVPVRR